MLTIYHYSNKDFTGYIKPSFFGNNSFTSHSVRVCPINRSFFYSNKGNKEFFFYGSKYCYSARINKNQLYDLNKDTKKIFVKCDWILNKMILKIKRLGYIGFIGNNGENIVCLFKPVKIFNKEVL